MNIFAIIPTVHDEATRRRIGKASLQSIKRTTIFFTVLIGGVSLAFLPFGLVPEGESNPYIATYALVLLVGMIVLIFAAGPRALNWMSHTDRELEALFDRSEREYDLREWLYWLLRLGEVAGYAVLIIPVLVIALIGIRISSFSNVLAHVYAFSMVPVMGALFAGAIALPRYALAMWVFRKKKVPV